LARSGGPGTVWSGRYRQVAGPPQLLSRVMATVRFVSWSMIPLGSLVAGVLAARFGSREVLLGSAFVLLAGPVIVGLSEIRRLRDLEDYPPPRSGVGPAPQARAAAATNASTSSGVVLHAHMSRTSTRPESSPPAQS